MNTSTDLIYDTKRKMLAKYPSFGSEIANCSIEYRDNLKYGTAATDGKNVYLDPQYFASLNEDERIFIMGHEVLHKKFLHMFRLIDKNGEKRDLDTWNTATDAIINANLERDGFKIKQGYINRPEALKYTAEEFYEILLKEKEMQEKQNQQGNGESQQEKSYDENSTQEQGTDGFQSSDHSMWEEAFEQQQNKEKYTQEQPQTEFNESQEQSTRQQPQMEFDENR